MPTSPEWVHKVITKHFSIYWQHISILCQRKKIKVFTKSWEMCNSTNSFHLWQTLRSGWPLINIRVVQETAFGKKRTQTEKSLCLLYSSYLPPSTCEHRPMFHVPCSRVFQARHNLKQSSLALLFVLFVLFVWLTLHIIVTLKQSSISYLIPYIIQIM